MTASTERHGRCLCGRVTVSAAAAGPKFGACHCRSCRRWTGGPLLATESGADVRFTGEAHIGVYASSDWAERGFCRECGTHLFWRLKAPVVYMIPVGLFDEATDWTFAEQVFIDEKPAFYAFANATRELTAAEVIAEYDPQGP